jgi:hypothetical protein
LEKDFVRGIRVVALGLEAGDRLEVLPLASRIQHVSIWQVTIGGNPMPSLRGLILPFVLLICISDTRAQQAAQPPAVTAANPATAQSAAVAKITNARVVEMTKLGLDDDVIIARIKHGDCAFQLSDADLLDLKKSGVSSKVVAVMLDSVPPSPPISTATQEPSDGKVRVFVTDSESWETRGSSAAGGNSNGWGASSSFSGGARPQTAEIIKTLNQRCPELTVTNVLGKADFVIVLDHEGGKGLLRHRNKVAVFNRNGDDIFSDSTRELGNAVKDACEAMTKSKK